MRLLRLLLLLLLMMMMMMMMMKGLDARPTRLSLSHASLSNEISHALAHSPTKVIARSEQTL
jgi:hypothetical protein